ncbi:MAG: Tm-1-like ATP-binding domain-containing protein, partial [Planctomycetota bacterium]|nr:Tm-1-like ATP-binding domain-containing protein [Planctomycetota bacterium]
EAAGKMGIPQVICPGATDMVNFGPPDTVPAKFKKRKFYQHNPTVTLMRTTPAENKRLGAITAEKLNQAKGPTAVLLPLGGVSAIDAPKQSFHDPKADNEYRKALLARINRKKVLVKEIDAHINDDVFAGEIVATFLELTQG